MGEESVSIELAEAREGAEYTIGFEALRVVLAEESITVYATIGSWPKSTQERKS